MSPFHTFKPFNDEGLQYTEPNKNLFQYYFSIVYKKAKTKLLCNSNIRLIDCPVNYCFISACTIQVCQNFPRAICM